MQGHEGGWVRARRRHDVRQVGEVLLEHMEVQRVGGRSDDRHAGEAFVVLVRGRAVPQTSRRVREPVVAVWHAKEVHPPSKEGHCDAKRWVVPNPFHVGSEVLLFVLVSEPRVRVVLRLVVVVHVVAALQGHVYTMHGKETDTRCASRRCQHLAMNPKAEPRRKPPKSSSAEPSTTKSSGKQGA